MWNTALGVSSFIVMPLAFIFLVYATGHAIFTWEWRTFLIALIIFLVAIIAHTVLGILSEG
jgi:hypothetical protein